METAVKIIQGLTLIAAAPLAVGTLRFLRARGQGRAGAPCFQPYYDIAKLLRKTSFRSSRATWIFRANPYISFGCFGMLAFSLPVFAPPLLTPDLVTLVYVMGLVAFLNALVGMSVSTPFGGLGSSRLMFLRVLVEPTLFLIVLALALKGHTTNIVTLVSASQASQPRAGALAGLMDFADPANLFLLTALFFVTLIEAHRIPVDNLETNLELTMISRAIWLEYSGPHLALAEWAESLKLLVLLTLLVNIFIPVGVPARAGAGDLLLPTAAYLIKMFVLILILTVWELCHLRIRFGDVMEQNMKAVFLAVVALAYIVVKIYRP